MMSASCGQPKRTPHGPDAWSFAKAMIPLFVVEEHHEAFFIWQLAIRDGLMPARGNTLLHVDEHADLEAPDLSQPVKEAVADLAQTYEFTFNELSCSEFIVPALYLGSFDDLVWMSHSIHTSDQLLVVNSANDQGGRTFELRRFTIVNGRPAPFDVDAYDGHPARYRSQAVDECLPTLQNVVLDIDLDYFSCANRQSSVRRIEVAKAEFESFRSNRYHFLRISQGNRVAMIEDDGRYFLRLDGRGGNSQPRRVSEAEIVRRVDRLADVLHQSHIQPRLIEIARSRFSGYTPGDQWPFIEGVVLERLASLYEYERRSLDEIYATLGHGR